MSVLQFEQLIVMKMVIYIAYKSATIIMNVTGKTGPRNNDIVHCEKFAEKTSYTTYRLPSSLQRKM